MNKISPKDSIQRRLFALICTCFMTTGMLHGLSLAQTNENLNVISHWPMYTDVQNVLYHFLTDQAFELLDDREGRVRSLNTEDQWQKYSEDIRESLHDMNGPFPEKTPLRSRITGTIERPDFTVEKIIFESQPGFYVTAALFLPDQRDEPAPAIIYASGHTTSGFRSDVYQHKIINLVKKGFIVFAFDPLGQGERIQYYDEEKGSSKVRHEHNYAGVQPLLTKSSLAHYFIWDGIRAVDYLLTRREVDPDRIGITGRSGGGTQSAYIGAMDDRIYAVAPEAYLTSFRYLLASRGLQDAEQNMYHGFVNGIDHGDFLLARVPKPSLMITTTRDYFSIQGARETFTEVQRAYKAFGKSSNLLYAEDDHEHGSTKANREAMYAFFQEHLNNPGLPDDQTVDLFEEEELFATPTGQLSTSIGGETVFSLQANEARRLTDVLKENRGNPDIDLEGQKKNIKNLSGYSPPAEQISKVFTGRYKRDGYEVEKYFITGEGDYPIPHLIFRPNQANGEWIVYLHPDGKAKEAGLGQEIEELVMNGYTIVAPDMLNMGEMGPVQYRGESFDHNYFLFYAVMQVGRSFCAIRAGDINRLIRTIISEESVKNDEVTVWAKGLLTIDALHAATFNDRIARVILVEPLLSYEALALNRFYDPKWVHGLVPGALTTYDLPDLGIQIAPRRLLYMNTVNENSEKLASDSDRIKPSFEGVRAVFNRMDASDHLGIQTAEDKMKERTKILQWLHRP